MTVRTFVGIAAAAVVMVAFGATPVAAGCCDQHKKVACCEKSTMACCDTHEQTPAVAVLIPRLKPEPRPVRETMTVWFTQPVRIGDRILHGKYIIEHDNNRMARGRPCTYIYAASDQRLPVAAFHCTHLNRAPGPRPSVTLLSLGEPNGMKMLTEFQFAGEVGAHGAPRLR